MNPDSKDRALAIALIVIVLLAGAVASYIDRTNFP